MQAHILEHTLSERPQARLLHEDLVSREEGGLLTVWAQLCCSRSRSK